MAGELSRIVRRTLPDLRLPEPRKAGPGALVYPFEPRLARLAAFYHRTSVRVLWDVLGIHREVLAGVREVARTGPLDGIGIDSWAIDYGLLDGNSFEPRPNYWAVSMQ